MSTSTDEAKGHDCLSMIDPSKAERCSAPPRSRKTDTTLLFVCIFMVYFLVRAVAWNNTILLEDNDSIAFLLDARVLLTDGLRQIFHLGPDRNPFYPACIALCAFPGYPLESAGRACSMVFSALLFLAVLGIGLRVSTRGATAIALLILSVNPTLITLSFAILSEPSYMAIVYLGLWLFLCSYRNPKPSNGALLGILYGMSFLARTEGIVYLVVIPLLQVSHFVFGRKRMYGRRQLVAWSCTFAICFSLLAGPQIRSVSQDVGHFAISGRQELMLLLNNDDGKSYDEKLFGLDFSQSQVNALYAYGHPEVGRNLASAMSPVRYAKKFLWNFDTVYQGLLGVLIGPLGFIFIGFGCLAVYLSGRRFETLVILTVIGVTVIPPLMYKVLMRYIAISGPALIVLEGIGIMYAAEQLLGRSQASSMRKGLVSVGFLSAVIVTFLHGIDQSVFRPESFNSQYSPIYLDKPAQIVRKMSSEGLHRPARIMSRHLHLSYFAGGEGVIMPFTDYNGLVTYSRSNNADFVFLEYRKLKSFPFMEAFQRETSHPDYIMLHQGRDSYGERVELYMVANKGQGEGRFGEGAKVGNAFGRAKE